MTISDNIAEGMVNLCSWKHLSFC